MLSSVQAFLSQIVDYAGMFPPANLPLEDAVGNYLGYRRGSPHAWMLGRLVCPAARLRDLTWAKSGRIPEDPLSLTALGQQSTTAAEFIPLLTADVRAVQEFRAAWGRDDLVDMVEVALPKAGLAETMEQLSRVAEILEQVKLRLFLEIPYTPNWRQDVERIVEHLRDLPVGLKLRAGGATREAFPSEAQIAFFIDRCRSARLPWKATAGLHHPRRHWDASLQLWHHGFINVFGAGVLALAHPLSEADLVAILADQDGRHFRFDADGFAWKDWSCPTAKIMEFRSTRVLSFGSCSFEEPCADLIGMGLI